jgi:hypothetical protein
MDAPIPAIPGRRSLTPCSWERLVRFLRSMVSSRNASRVPQIESSAPLRRAPGFPSSRHSQPLFCPSEPLFLVQNLQSPWKDGNPHQNQPVNPSSHVTLQNRWLGMGSAFERLEKFDMILRGRDLRTSWNVVSVTMRPWEWGDCGLQEVRWCSSEGVQR